MNCSNVEEDTLDLPDDENEWDEPICSYCNGSGEGLYDGTICFNCNGTGVIDDDTEF